MFKKKVLGKLFKPKSREVTEERRKFHNDKHHSFWREAVRRVGQMKNCLCSFNWEALRKDTTRRTRNRKKDNILMHLQEMEQKTVDRDQWQIAVNMVTNLHVSQRVTNFLSSPRIYQLY